ncbi:rho guanine nucleotide exchange factor 12-like isoform X6 [Mercenaria mercenaria]|uniref:rho guanine nucleotide exchange factor 12-like isoform X6 n=1 Tax=Mercenaria mercenaria TaxID=6596 RepID=UPI00234F9544|nr:rho guanine nucleotide exchange factor 12-like isoform X6 [Mercenaria mercenaria]
MPLKKWRSMDIFNFSPRENPIMESISNKFAEISQSHAGTLLRNRRLGSLGSVKSTDDQSPKKDEQTDSPNAPLLLQRTAIIQKDEKGYGLTVSGDNPVYVASVKTGGAAEKAGVQVGDKIIKVNGKLVTNSNHTEVVKMIRAGSYVALTLLGKPSNTHLPNRDSIYEREPSTRESSGSFRDSIVDKITGPQPVDAEKEKEVRQQKVNTIRVMYETVHEEYDKIRKECKANPLNSKLQDKLQEKEKTLKILEAQLQSIPGGTGNFSRDSQPPVINVDSESVTSDTHSVSSWLPKKERKHMKHSSSPGAMYSPAEAQERGSANVSRSKSDVSTRKNALSEYSFGHLGYKRTESSPEVSKSQVSTGKKVKKSSSFKGFRRTYARKMRPSTASVPYTVSDLGSDSPCTSPSSSPTPIHSQNLDIDTVTGDSGIEDGSQNSIVMSTRPSNTQIIGMDDDDFASDDESSDYERRSKPPVSPFLSKLQNFETGDSRVFSDLRVLETKPAYMAIFMHYVLTQHNPAPLLFYQMTSFYRNAQGSSKDLKKWAYEIHSTFIVHNAPLRVTSFGDHIVQEIDTTLTFRSEKEDLLRSIFNNARVVAKEDVQKLVEDLRQKKEQGLIEGAADLKDHMDKNEELKIVEKYLYPDLEKCVMSEEDDKMSAQGWAIATFLRHIGLNKPTSHSGNVLERVPSFVTKDKQMSKFKFSNRSKTKNQKGHQFVLCHLYKQEFCLKCNKVLWGVGFQGYQCQTCEQCVHRQCVDDLDEVCNKKKKRASTALNVFKPKQPSIGVSVRSALSDIITSGNVNVIMHQATPMINDSEQVSSPTLPNQPNVFPQPLKDPEDKEISAFKDSGHSVGSLVNRFEKQSPEHETTGKITRKNAISPRQSRRPSMNQSLSVPPRKNSDIGRSESMKGRGDTITRPTKRSNSDLAMDENTLRALQSASSSTSSLRSMESPSTSMDTLTAQIQDDSDFDVEPELPSLKQVLGEETVRKLKPKEKKRQDVINELFYTEKCHVRNLKILDKLFYRPMLKEQAIPQDFTKSLFPNLETMIRLHGSLNDSMKNRRKEKSVISNVGDLLLQRFDGEAGENFRNGCAIFCRNQSHTLENLKIRVRKEPKMAQLLSDAENNPLCQRLALKDIIPKQFMRLTKYPLLIENLLKYTQTNTEEYSNLERAQKCSKHILEYVNQAVKDCENHQRLIDLQRRIDKKSIDNSPEMEELRTFDASKHKLLHDGSLIWSLNNRKQIELHVVLLERAMVLLQKQDERLVLKLQSTQLVAGKTDSKKHSPLLWLNNVLARNDATDKKAFFVVNTSKAGPQIYKLVAGTADEQKTWTKYITQASEAMKKNEINQKKKPPVPEEIPRERMEQPGTANGDLQDIESETLVHPGDVTYNDPVINTAVQVITPLEKLRQNDEHLAAVLEERQGLIAELLNVSPNDIADKVQDVTENEEGEGVPQELIAACQHQTTEIVNMMRENTPPQVIPNTDSGEHVESVEDMSLPIPMERLRDMANRMNQILTNLLAQTRATATMTPMTQAAVNSRDEERDRLRRELKFAQEELNRLRRIQKMQMEAQKEKGEDGEPEVTEEKPERPASIVSETSTVSESEGDENKEDSEQTDEQETEVTEDGMPGLPIEPEIVSELETLNEVSPGTMDTLVDADSALELTEISGIGSDEMGNYEEAEVEAVEEELHEMEPPDEDQMEDLDIDTPIVKITGPDNDESDEDEGEDDSDDDDDDDDDNDNKDEDTNRSGRVEDEMTEEHDVDDIDNGDNKLTGQTDDVMDRLRVDANTEGDSDTDASSDKKENGEVFHDAIEGQEERNNTEITEDPGGIETDSKTKEVINEGSENIENLAKCNTEIDTVDSENKEQSNNNIEIDDSDMMLKQKDICYSDPEDNISEIKNDDTVKSLNETQSSEQV